MSVCLKPTTLALFKANLLKQPKFSRSSSDSLRTESQKQRHFDVETVRLAKLFVKLGWHVLVLFIPKRIAKSFLDVVFRELLKKQPFQTDKKLKRELSDIKSIYCTLPNKQLTEQLLFPSHEQQWRQLKQGNVAPSIKRDKI